MGFNVADIMNVYSSFKQNPMGLLSRRFNIPQNIQNPQDIIQHLLNSGQISQEQLNNVMRMRNNPQIQSLFR